MSTEQLRPASGGTTQQSPQASDITDMDDLTPEEIIASINADSRRTVIRNTIFALGTLGWFGLLMYSDSKQVGYLYCLNNPEKPLSISFTLEA